jgi:hypothetical protein
MPAGKIDLLKVNNQDALSLILSAVFAEVLLLVGHAWVVVLL